MNPTDLVAGALFAGAIVALAWRAHALTPAGALAAAVVGTVTYAAGTLWFTTILLAFFVPATLLSRLGKHRKRELVDVGEQGARDAWQVLANGGVATVCCIAWAATHDLHWGFAFAGAYAAAAADTWATEIGTAFGGRARSILTLRPLANGLSGGVTVLGTAGEVFGAVWIGLASLAGAALLTPAWKPFGNAGADDHVWVVVHVPELLRWCGTTALAGVAGATIDSVAGATIQELRYCDACARSCETDPHACGAPTRLVRGVRGVSNDAVNLLATLAGAVCAFALA